MSSGKKTLQGRASGHLSRYFESTGAPQDSEQAGVLTEDLTLRDPLMCFIKFIF